MPRRIGFIAAWVMVTLVAVAIAAQAVGSVRDQVTNRPSPIVDVSALVPTAVATQSSPSTPSPPPPPASTTTLVATTSTATTAVPDTSTTSTTLVAVTTTTTTPEAPASTSTTTTTTTAAPTTTTTTAAPTTTTTTAAPPEMTTKTYEMIGGWVRIRYGEGNVFLDGAGANAGFTMKVDDNGPEEVEVEFRGESHESEFSAEFEAGELRVEVKEVGDDEDDTDQ